MTSASNSTTPASLPTLRGGMVGMGMIFDETYAPFFEAAQCGVYDPEVGAFRVELAGAATRTAPAAAGGPPAALASALSALRL